MPSIELTPQEREAARGIWVTPGPLTESGRVEAIRTYLGRTGTRGWCRLHFGPPGGAFKIMRPEKPPEVIRQENARRWPYTRNPTGTAMNPGMNYLSELVIRPGIRKRLEPLCLYRGAMAPGAAHRYWNFFLLMMAAEAETLSDGMKLYGNAAFAQLCGPQKVPEKYRLKVFAGRLWDHPEVTDNIQGLGEYVKSLELGPSHLTPVEYVSHDLYCAPWRTSDHPEWDPKAERPEYGVRALYYPFLQHDPEKDSGHSLVLLANQLVPRTLPDAVRADICQDLVEGILTGAVSVDNARDFVVEYIGKTYRAYPSLGPTRFRTSTLSLDKGLVRENKHGDKPAWTELI